MLNAISNTKIDLESCANNISYVLNSIESRISNLESKFNFDFVNNETVISWDDFSTNKRRYFSLNKLEETVEKIDKLENIISNLEERIESVEYYAEEETTIEK